MTKRARSPNYPSIGLPEALERLQSLWDAIQRHPAPREIVATGMGYSGLHGASGGAVSALRKYGLLEREGADLKISERGMAYLHPEEPSERVTAIKEAATEPELFAALAERFPGAVVNEELIRNYLLRNNFTPAAASNVINAYRDTMELVNREAGQRPLEPEEAPRDGPEEIPQFRPDALKPVENRGEMQSSGTKSVPAGKFRVSMNDEFFVDVNAVRLDRGGVKKLIDWLKANEELVPAATETVSVDELGSEAAEGSDG